MENLKNDITKDKMITRENGDKLFRIMKTYYEDLDYLCGRLQKDYNGEEQFEQDEQDRLALYAILEMFDKIDSEMESE